MFDKLLDGLRTLVGGTVTNGDERRHVTRLHTEYPVVCKTEDATFRSVVTDLSIEGLRLSGVDDIKPGTRMSVALQTRSAVPTKDDVKCKVVWCRLYPNSGRRLAGLRYDDSVDRMAKSWVKRVLTEVGLIEKAIYQNRNKIRLQTNLGLAVTSFEGTSLGGGRLHNLGAGGALVEIDQALMSGRRVKLHIGPLKKLSVLVIEGKVLQHEADTETGTHYHRVRFTDTPPRTLKLLGSYIFDLLRSMEH